MTKETEKLYWEVHGYCFEFIYDWADRKFYKENVTDLVETLIKNVKSKANPIKVENKLEHIFKNATYAFDLPEHTEKHNGYHKDYQYTSKVMKILGYTFQTKLLT